MEVSFDPREDCVLATFAGPVSLEGLLQAFHRTYEAAAERGLRLILIDCSGLYGTLSTLERFRLGESAVAYWLGKSPGTSWLSTSIKPTPKIAIVGKAPLVDGFGALAASNRGVNAKTFSEVQQALDWLGVGRVPI